MDSKRQRIIDAIIARMQGISIGTGYKTDLGAHVEDWQTNWSEDDLPGLSVCDLINGPTQANNQLDAGAEYNILPVQLRIFCKFDRPAAELRRMQADIWTAIKVDSRWNGLARGTRPMR